MGKKMTLVIVVLFILPLGALAPRPQATSADSGNLVGNPGFESSLAPGVTSVVPTTVGNWVPVHAGATQVSAPSPSHGGTQSASTQASAGGTGAFIVQDFPNFPFQSSYNLSFWVYPQQGTQVFGFDTGWDRGTGNVTGSLGILISPTGGYVNDWGVEASIPALVYGQWHQVSIVEDACTQTHHLLFDGTVVATTTTTVPTAQLGSILFGETNGTATQTSQFYWDDVSLATVSCPVADTSAPTTTATLGGPQGNNGWYTGSVNMTLAATDPDGPADVASTTYTIDGGTVQVYATPFTLSGDGTHTIAFASTDKAGNKEATQSAPIKVDATAPTTTAVPAGTIGANGQYVGNVQMTLSASDGSSGSGIARTTYTLDGNAAQIYSAPFTVSGNGVHTITFSSQDVAGNTEATHQTTVGIGAKPNPEMEVQHLAIPSYFYPGPLWDQMAQAHPPVELAIINPSSGPGAVSNPDYVAQVRRSQAAGLTILGYVHTSYGTRAAADVKAEIDAYATWYHVDGIFFDEASTNCVQQGYYADLTAYAKQRTTSRRAVHTVLNPGTQTGECYLSVADVIVTFEGDASAYQNGYSAPSWVTNYAHDRFWHLIYNVPTAQQMQTIIQLSKERGAGWVYVTPDTLPNPWNTLPTGSYWSGELAAATASGERGERRADVRAFGATGDGATDDTAGFTQALASLSEGGTLIVPPGTYRIKPGALTIPSKTTVQGDRATIKPFGTGFDVIEFRGTDVGMTGVTIDGENHVVRGVTIVGGSKHVLLSRDTIENFTMPTDPADPNYKQTPAGIRIEGNGDTITIDGVTVKNVVANHANDTRDGHDTWVARGIWITPESGQTTSTHITIRGSSFSEVGPKDDGDCIVIQDSTDRADLTIANNTFDRCHKRAIKIQVPGATVTGNRITNPFQSDNAFQVAAGGQGTFPYDMYSAIAAYASDVTVERNTIEGVGSFYAGIEVNASCTVPLDLVTISGNTVRMGASSTLAGASAIRAFGPVNNLTITGNTLDYADTGIILIPGTPDAVLQGMAAGNRFAHVTTKVASRAGC